MLNISELKKLCEKTEMEFGTNLPVYILIDNENPELREIGRCEKFTIAKDVTIGTYTGNAIFLGNILPSETKN